MLQIIQWEGMQAFVEVRRRASHFFSVARTGERTLSSAELFPNGLSVPLLRQNRIPNNSAESRQTHRAIRTPALATVCPSSIACAARKTKKCSAHRKCGPRTASRWNKNWTKRANLSVIIGANNHSESCRTSRIECTRILQPVLEQIGFFRRGWRSFQQSRIVRKIQVCYIHSQCDWRIS